MAESLTLYKLIILYMLNKVTFPLTNSQLSDFILGQEYTTYFHLQQAINEMLEANLLKVEVIRNSSRYHMTEDGRLWDILKTRSRTPSRKTSCSIWSSIPMRCAMKYPSGPTMTRSAAEQNTMSTAR